MVRYRRSIETTRLRLAVLDDDIVMRVYNGMTTVSPYSGHDRPAAAGATWPAPDTIKQHLDELIACIGLIKKEAGIVEQRRKKFEKPPVIMSKNA